MIFVAGFWLSPERAIINNKVYTLSKTTFNVQIHPDRFTNGDRKKRRMRRSSSFCKICGKNM
jgi:hypothetical protein